MARLANVSTVMSRHEDLHVKIGGSICYGEIRRTHAIPVIPGWRNIIFILLKLLLSQDCRD